MRADRKHPVILSKKVDQLFNALIRQPGVKNFAKKIPLRNFFREVLKNIIAGRDQTRTRTNAK
jgi:hypothetical protein